MAMQINIGMSGGYGVTTLPSRPEFSPEAKNKAQNAVLDQQTANAASDEAQATAARSAAVESGSSVTPDSAVTLQQQQDLPLVVMDWGPSMPHSDRIQDNSQRGGYLATRHLIELGHRQIAIITGPQDKQPALERLAGYQQAMAEAQLPIDSDWICHGDFDCEGGYQAMQQLMQCRMPPSAVFACNDLMAMGAIRALQEQGLSVPHDISVIGYDNIGFAAYLNPPLTSISQPKQELGQLAVQSLLERIQQPQLPGRTLRLEPDLVLRDSTSPPRSPADE